MDTLTSAAAPVTAPVPGFKDEDYDVFHRIGTLTRQLHDALRELGYDTHLQGAIGTLPDARTRLDYIARLTGEAAEKVLNAVDVAKAAQDGVDAHLERLAPAWRALARDGQAPSTELVRDTAAFLETAGTAGQAIQDNLMGIMMAQDFHDLTGQVIRKIANLAMHLEEQLVKLLVASTPPDKRPALTAELDGPVVDAGAKGGVEVVTNQAQVDDLLAELGF